MPQSLLSNFRPPSITRWRILLFALSSAILFSSSCSAPLAPSYRILKESREVKFVPGAPPELHVSATFQLENSGTADLKFLDVALPDEKRYGRENLRIQVDGREVEPRKLPEELHFSQPLSLRVPFDPPWEQKQKRALAIEYSFRSPQDSGTRITLGDTDFHLSALGWFPALQPPRHFMSPYPSRSDKTIVRIQAPSNFEVLSRGAPAGHKQVGSEIEHRFLLRTKDLAPFVVAGRYVENSPGGQSDSAVFWTFQPLTGDSAAAGQQLATAWQTLQNAFGPLDRDARGLHIVESSGLRGHLPGEEGAAAASFPGGALVNPAALALGVSSEVFLEKVTHALAHSWFTGQMYPSEDAALGMSEGLPEYATLVTEEARGGEAARRQRIQEFLRRYDEASKLAVEKPLGLTVITDPIEQRRIAMAKAALFYVGLEDSCGEAAIRTGLNNLVTLLRGQEVGYDDMRSALEQSTGKNLAEMFRTWLYVKGIPKDFLDRYALGAKTQSNGKGLPAGRQGN
jgi:peptidase M1-like protein